MNRFADRDFDPQLDFFNPLSVILSTHTEFVIGPLYLGTLCVRISYPLHVSSHLYWLQHKRFSKISGRRINYKLIMVEWRTKKGLWCAVNLIRCGQNIIFHLLSGASVSQETCFGASGCVSSNRSFTLKLWLLTFIQLLKGPFRDPSMLILWYRQNKLIFPVNSEVALVSLSMFYCIVSLHMHGKRQHIKLSDDSAIISQNKICKKISCTQTLMYCVPQGIYWCNISTFWRKWGDKSVITKWTFNITIIINLFLHLVRTTVNI